MTESPSEEGVVVRLCVPVSMEPFMPLRIPGATSDRCHKCDSAVWVDVNQKLTPSLPSRVLLLCLDCAIANQKIAKSMLANMPAALQHYQMTETAMGWPIDVDETEL